MRLKLTYSYEVVQKPILAEVILKTKFPLNILEAKVNANKGELVISIPAEGKKLEEVIQLFQDAGVEVQTLTRMLQLNSEKCISCGACVSPCPTEAIKLKPDWTIEIDEEKCVACRICVNACPMKAITVL